MKRYSLRWQLYPSYLLIIVMAVVALTWWAINLQDRFYLQITEDDLVARAQIIEQQAAPIMAEDDRARLQPLATEIGQRSGTRITMILTDGVVVGDSEEDPATMENHGDRPEIADALVTGRGVSTRYSSTLRKRLMYIAIRSEYEGRVVGVVRVAVSVTLVDQARETLRYNLLLAGLVIALLAALINYFVSARITRPLKTLQKGAERFAQGHLNRRLPVASTEEIGSLAEALNEMAAQLKQRIATIDGQRQEQRAVLSSMSEGVMAVDSERRLLGLNAAAAKILGIDDIDAMLGQTVHESVRSSALQEIVHETLKTGQTRQAEIGITTRDQEAVILVSASTLHDDTGTNLGCVVVMNDVTMIRRLERIREEFVGNVSHELKTPITSIKGSVETVLDGAFDDPPAARRFLEMASRQADRLHNIVEDLLSLSRLESSGQVGGVERQVESLNDMIKTAIDECRSKADSREVKLTCHCEDTIKVPINPSLIRQALVNLIDNALNHSEVGSSVVVTLADDNTGVRIHITDTGRGIAPQHIPRLFERFYRVDEARSREHGGTGLGLAIVKHIVLVHGGTVEVTSELGRGSVFTILLPKE